MKVSFTFINGRTTAGLQLDFFQWKGMCLVTRVVITRAHGEDLAASDRRTFYVQKSPDRFSDTSHSIPTRQTGPDICSLVYVSCGSGVMSSQPLRGIRCSTEVKKQKPHYTMSHSVVDSNSCRYEPQSRSDSNRLSAEETTPTLDLLP